MSPKPTKLKCALAGEELAAEVERLARIGAANREIACHVGLSPAALKRRCGPAIARGRTALKLRLRAHQVDRACGKEPSERMLLWLGRHYLKQNATAKTAADQSPPKAYININLEQV